MKRLVLALTAILLVVPVMAQQTAQLRNLRPHIKPLATLQVQQPIVLPDNIKAQPLRAKALVGTEPVHRTVKSGTAVQGVKGAVFQAPGDSVGFTYYDYQTNYAMPDRVVIYPDEGLAQMVWMSQGMARDCPVR